jgi:hypothetical protein
MNPLLLNKPYQVKLYQPSAPAYIYQNKQNNDARIANSLRNYVGVQNRELERLRGDLTAYRQQEQTVGRRGVMYPRATTNVGQASDPTPFTEEVKTDIQPPEGTPPVTPVAQLVRASSIPTVEGRPLEELISEKGDIPTPRDLPDPLTGGGLGEQQRREMESYDPQFGRPPQIFPRLSAEESEPQEPSEPPPPPPPPSEGKPPTRDQLIDMLKMLIQSGESPDPDLEKKLNDILTKQQTAVPSRGAIQTLAKSVGIDLTGRGEGIKIQMKADDLARRIRRFGILKSGGSGSGVPSAEYSRANKKTDGRLGRLQELAVEYDIGIYY